VKYSSKAIPTVILFVVELATMKLHCLLLWKPSHMILDVKETLLYAKELGTMHLSTLLQLAFSAGYSVNYTFQIN